MKDLLNIETLRIFLFFVVPGYVGLKVFDLIVPSERRNFSNSLIEIVSFSMLNLALVFPLISLVNTYDVRNSYPLLFYLFWFGTLFISPAILAVIAKWLLGSSLLRGRVLHPTPTGWDFFFGKGIPCWILFHLKSGEKLGGFYGINSFTSSFPQEKDIYVQEIWKVDADGRFLERVDRTGGAIINFEQCKLIEMFTVEEN